MRLFSLLLFTLKFSYALTQAAPPILERRITVQFENEPISSALEQIGRMGSFSFSYNPAILPSDQSINLKMKNVPVKEVLNEIFRGTVNYKEKPNHLILTKAPALPPANTTIFVVSGYVEDQLTGQKIKDVSIYDKISLKSSTTDDYGFYKIKLDDGKEKATLSISKREYYDTLIEITSAGNNYVNVQLRPIRKDTAVAKSDIKSDSIDTKRILPEDDKEELELPFESDANIQNIRDTIYRDIQVSFLPFLGTNERLSGNVINNYSINFLGGYSMGTRQIELGFFVNIDRGDVSWLQIAGFGNLVGRNVYGIQGSGFFNLNGGETKAVQLSGFANTNFGETRGVQLSGFANTNLDATYGVQVAGFSNFSKGGVGVQVAGFTNTQLGEYKGSQFAGFSNINKGGIYGTQIAGFTNVALGHVDGSQLSTFFNFGRKIRGTQIGLINYADSLGGVPLGLMSFVKHGYHKLEASADEVFFTNLSFRTGVRKFYNILTTSIKPTADADGNNIWSYGYGLGTARKITRWLYVNADITSQQVNKGNLTKAISLLNKIHIGLDFQLAKNFSIYAGATLNGYLTENAYTDYPVLFTDVKPHVFYDRTVGGDNNLKAWLGWKAGLRFF